MMNTTTDEIRSKRVLRIAWSLAIGLHLIAVVVLINNKGLLTETLSFNREETNQQVAAVEKRAKKREAFEKQRREKIILKQEDAKTLSKKEENKRLDQLVQAVEKIKQDYEAIKQVEKAKLEALRKDHLEKFNKSYAKKLDELTHQVHRRTGMLKAAIKKDPELEQLNIELEENLEVSLAARIAIKEYREEKSPREQQREEAVNGAEQMLANAKAAIELAEEHMQVADESVEALKRVVERLETFTNEMPIAAQNDKKLEQSLAKAPPPIDDSELLAKAEQLEQLSTDQLYDTAVELEQKMSARYENARISELAATTDRDFEEASERMSDLGETKRPDLGTEIREKQVHTVKDLNEFRETLDHAVSETENIRARAQNRLRQLDPNATAEATESEPQGRNIATKHIAHQKRMYNAVRQSKGHSIDLTALMNKNKEPVLGEGTSNTSKAERLAEPELTEEMVVTRALPGRRFTEDSTRQGWLYIDTWYVIGPWDLKEFEGKSLPPETEIDLDAEYSNGKQGMVRRARTARERFELDGKLRWQFHQSDKLFVRPPNETGDAIYYAYTELHFDRDRDILLAIGIDDHSTIWLNDEVIWRHRVNSWNIGSSLRKVTFKQGYNTVLIRMENGGPLMDFSLVLCPPSALQAQAQN
ncbi:hypothetical protein QEH52_02215 [Coraliomargarita sp. SDUM461003]|uniref:PA14 domain-containing protein n=1 Tax=Thalassobacterium maritimum TaxID=3041265 RepID=A0ABU1AQ84_9BACT|nr:hypothetical protein [Coraliomargarita sp. SDUM461003]MDQ8206305.1 hypothetical protein [Coraliomargarita sp. SDUM461003]